VVAYVRSPLILAVEIALLLLVTWHAMLGLHAVLLDLGLKGRAARVAAHVLGRRTHERRARTITAVDDPAGAASIG